MGEEAFLPLFGGAPGGTLERKRENVNITGWGELPGLLDLGILRGKSENREKNERV